MDDAAAVTKEHRRAKVPDLTPAERLICKVLCVPQNRAPVDESETHRIFGASIFLSALRCLLSYVVLPIVLPLVGAASNIGPAIGIPVAVVALVFDVKGVRRFWLAHHRQRWAFTLLYAAVGSMVTALLVIDILHFV